MCPCAGFRASPASHGRRGYALRWRRWTRTPRVYSLLASLPPSAFCGVRRSPMGITKRASSRDSTRHAGVRAPRQGGTRRGSALLMVLWISAALAAVAFSLANTVRGETDRTSTAIDEIRGYYLASGAVYRAAVELLWSVTFRGERKIKQGAARVGYTLPADAA